MQLASASPPSDSPALRAALSRRTRVQRWWTNQPLRAKGWVVVAIPIAALLLSAAGFTIQGSREEHAVKQVQHTYQVKSTLQSIDLLLLSAESSIRGYIYNGNPDSSAEFDRATSKLPSKVEELAALVSDNPTQRARLFPLRTAIDDRLVTLTAVRDAASAGGAFPATLPDDLRTASLTAREAVRTSLNELNAGEDVLLAERTATQDRARTREGFTLIGVIVLGLAGSLLATTLFTSGISGRVQRLAENADRLALGDDLIPLNPAADEIGRLSVRMSAANDLLRERERALAHERDLLSALMDNIPYPVFFKDRQSRFTRVNRATALAAKVARSREFVGKTDADYLPIGSAQSRFNDEQRLMETGIPIVNQLDVTTWADGQTRWTLNNKAPMFDQDGTIIGMVGSSTDITEMKEAEAERAHLAAIVDTSNDAIVGTDLAGTITSWNPSATRLYGYTAAEAIGRKVSILAGTQEDSNLTQLIANIVAGEEGNQRDTVHYTQSGHAIDVSLTISPVLDATGAVMGVAVISRDISARKQAEAELQSANKELEAFTYSVSHDLRAPLRAMNGFSRILLEDYDAEIPADAKHFLQLIQDNARQMGQLVDDLLAFSRLGRQQLVKVPVDLDHLVRSVIDDLQPDWQGRNVRFTIGELPTLDVDPGLMRQVFINLIGNAIKFTHKRETAEITVSVLPDTDPNHVEFAVRDNGVGFDMAYTHKLFGVFQRLHRAEEYDGTGVGLALVQRVIHRHGGRIRAESTLNQGATFSVTLPREPAQNVERLVEPMSVSEVALAASYAREGIRCPTT